MRAGDPGPEQGKVENLGTQFEYLGAGAYVIVLGGALGQGGEEEPKEKTDPAQEGLSSLPGLSLTLSTARTPPGRSSCRHRS